MSPAPSPPRFFITHSFKDADFANRLAADLRAWQLDGFFDLYSIKPGDKIAERINQGLEECDVYVPVLSFAALSSRWCSDEINAAISLSNEQSRSGRPNIIPVLVEDCQSRMPPLLRGRLYINFAGRYNEAFRELLGKGFGIDVQKRGRLAYEQVEKEYRAKEQADRSAREKDRAELQEREKTQRVTPSETRGNVSSGVRQTQLRAPSSGLGGVRGREWVPLAISGFVLVICAILLFVGGQFAIGMLGGGTKPATPTRIAVATLPATAIPTRVALPTAPPPTEAPVPVLAKVTERTVNVREMPNTNGKVVATLRNDDQVTLVGRNSDSSWFQINIAGSSAPGWVFAQTLQMVSGDPNTLPVAGPTPTPTKGSAAQPTATLAPLGTLSTPTPRQ